MTAVRTRSNGARLALAAAGLAVALTTVWSWPLSATDIEVPGLDDVLIRPFADPGRRGTVFLFVTTDCPIGNRYTPAVRRLFERFGDDVRFWLVYADGSRTVEEMRRHREDFGYPFAALRDPDLELVRLTGATVTPEAAVYDASGRLVYRGRIDDRFVDFGVTRAAPTTHDLENVLERIAVGETVGFSTTRAVGCYIPDL